MKETCYNCEHFWCEIHNPDNEEEHEHDFCILHERFLNGWHQYGWLIDKTNGVVYDDLECGIASCYMFEPKDNPRFNDEWFNKHKAHNEKVKAEVAEIAKAEGWYWEEEKEG